MGYNPFSADNVRIERELQLRKLQSVTEAYVGKSENLRKATKLLDVMLRRDKENGAFGRITKTQETTPENKQFEALMEKEFGFNKFSLHWLNDAAPNAFTLFSGLLINKNPDDEHTSTRGNRRYYDAKHQYHCVVCFISNLAVDAEMTADEVMAILLHEVGHNFDCTVATKIVKLARLCFSYGISEIEPMIQNLYFDVMKEMPLLNKILSLKEDIFFYINILPVPVEVAIRMLKDPMGILFGILLIPSERFADTLPVMYGYGEAQASAMRKMNKPSNINSPAKRVIYRIPILRTLYDLIEVPAMMIASIFDAHPYTINRIVVARKNLEKDYNNPEVPKDLKPEIKRQIIAIKKIEDETLEDSFKEQRFLAYLRDFIFAKSGNLMPPDALVKI